MQFYVSKGSLYLSPWRALLERQQRMHAAPRWQDANMLLVTW